jgi:hypothetical protein
MADAIEALVGHIFIVGGRAVSATPPGALVELPPRKAPRGRDQDTFFTLITPSGATAENSATASFYEQLARLAAETYFSSSGSVTSGLREAINGVNNFLIDHNQLAGQRYSVNIACLVLRGREAFTARTGECLCLLRLGESFLTYPERLTEPYSGPLLGHSPVIDIKLSRHDIAPGHVLVFSDLGFVTAERERLQAALGGEDIQAVMERLRPLGSQQAQAMIVQFTTAHAPDPVMTTAASPLKVMRSSHAPTAKVGLAAPIRPKLRTEQLPTASAVTGGAGAVAGTNAAVPAAITAPDVVAEAVVTPASDQTAPVPLDAVAPPLEVDSLTAAPTTSAAAFASAALMAHERESGLAGISEVADPNMATPTPEAVDEAADPDAVIAEVASPAPVAPRTPFIVRTAGATANVLERFGKGLSRGLDRMLPEATEEGPRIPSMLAAAMALVIPIVVVFVIVAARLAQVDTTQFEQMVRNVEESAQQARTIPLDDARNARTAWLGVLQRIEEAEQNSGRTNDPTLVAIRAEAQRILDQFAMVTRRDVIPLRTFEGDTGLRGVVVRAQTDLYTLDVTNSALWHDRLNPNDKSVFRRSTGAVVVQGQAVGAFSVRELIDMAWMADGSSKNRIVALDSQGILVTYSPVFAPATATRLAGVEQWVKPAAITVWRDRLYVLDVGANQIWRYTPVGGSYPNPPDAYFDEPLDLSQAVDMGIDSTPGNVYILFADGKLKKYLAGREQPFDFGGLPEDGLKAGGSLYIDADAIFPAIYLTDPRDQAIYQVTLRGQFQRRFKARETTTFRKLSNVYIDGEDVYATTASTVYYFSIADLRTSAPASTP